MKRWRTVLTLALLLGAAMPVESSRWADRIIKKMSRRDKVAQMIFHVVRPNFLNRDHEYYAYLKNLIQDVKLGGMHVWTSPTYDMAYLLNQYQSWAEVPLLVSADMERGAGTVVLRELFSGRQGKTPMPEYISGGGVPFPPQMALGATRSPELAYQMGWVTAREARRVGIHVNFAPVVDVNNNPDNPIINVRSFGENVELVSLLAGAYIRGSQAGGLIATAKHFPGHGDTSLDTHIELPVLNFDLPRLESIELPPFVASIQAGVKAIMSVHIALPAITGDQKPATLSPRILTDLLRVKLGFKGLVVTDAMVMDGITKHYDPNTSAVEAVKAGADILLFTPDPEAAIVAITAAVEKGEITEHRIEASVRRILEAKRELGLDRERTVDLALLERDLGSKEHFAVARTIAEKSITLLRNQERVLPLEKGREFYLLKISDDFWPNDGRVFRDFLADRLSLKGEFYAWKESGQESAARISEQIPENSLVICPAFFYIGSWKGKLAVPEPIVKLLQDLTAKQCRLVLISFASPYIFRELPLPAAALCGWYSSFELEQAAARVLLGDLNPTGKFPVSIPGLFNYGDGLGY